MVTPTQRRELLGLALLGLAFFLALSLVPAEALGEVGRRYFPSGNLIGPVGAFFAALGPRLVGVGAPLLPILPALGAAAAFRWIEPPRAGRLAALVGGSAVLLAISGIVLPPEPGVGVPLSSPRAGWIGNTLGVPLVALLGWLGSVIALALLAVALPIATVGWNPLPTAATRALSAARSVGGALFRRWSLPNIRRRRASAGAGVIFEPGGITIGEAGAPPEPEAERKAAARPPPKPRRKPDSAQLDLEDAGDPTSSKRPPMSLLSPPPPQDAAVSERELDRLGEVLIETLRTFKVDCEIGGRTTGPVVTQFEVVPAPGVKVNKIANLDADLALALKAASVRIVAPIPGKGAVGVEVPNPEPETVYLREILGSPAFQRARGLLPMALGKDLTGRPYVADLSKMPHLLIAGATGSGKSVCVNTLITSLIYRYSPSDLRLLLVDPKMVELSMYSDLPHLRHPVVTDPKDAATVLKWAVLEMEHRYALLSENGARSLAEFNRRAEEGQVLRRAEPVGLESDPDRWIYKDGPLPYIVVVLDELADLMLAVQSEIERPLAQLAQKARAIGIHLIVATQRPSVNVITGLIKANFPCRIAFRVSSKVDSRTILDQNGADALLGNGDMLFLPPGKSDPVRVQGAFISTADTEQIMGWYRDHERPDMEEDILEVVRSREAEEAQDDFADIDEDRDALFRQAAEVCIQHEQGSTSLLQRRLRIGYGRAARIVDQLHHAGILGPPDGSKPREVLVGLDALDLIDA